MSKYTFQVNEDEDADLFLASWSVKPESLESGIGFRAYRGAGSDFTFKRRKLLVAETPHIEYSGENNLDLNCRYVVGIVHKDSDVLELVETVPVHLAHTVKSTKPADSVLIGNKSFAAANELGTTFGTKKNKQMIKAQEINQVRVENMNDVAAKMKETISVNSSAIRIQDVIDTSVFSSNFQMERALLVGRIKHRKKRLMKANTTST